MGLPVLLQKLFKSGGYGPELNDGIVSKSISIQDWDSGYNYPANVLAKAGGGIYRSVAASGPGVAAGAQDPLLDAAHAYWDQVPTDDENVVHRTGNETIAGGKIFTENFFRLFTSYTAGDTPSDAVVGRFEFVDKNGYALGNVEQVIFNDGTNQITLHAFKSGDYTVSSNVWAQVALDGTRRAGVTCEQFRGALNSFPTLGLAGSGRWGQIYSTSSTISTSDERQKQSIESVPDAVLDAWGDCGFVQYQMRDAVAEKGEGARLHSGMIAQRIGEVFKAHGLDAAQYGLFCYDEWAASPATGIDPAVEAGDEYSLRYEEALCMEAAYQRRRADRAEARIASLEARLAALEAKLNG